MRWIIGGKAAKGCGASPSQMGRFETNWLARSENLAALTDLSGRWIDQVAPHRSRERIVLDMDSSVSPTHGEQENSVWNGHFGCTCYHPLFVFNQFGDLERCALRPGNVHSANGWEDVLKPIIARCRGTVETIAFRQIRFSRRKSVVCSNGRLGDHRIMSNDSTRAFITRRRVGPIRVGSLPKWNGILESCSHASALS